MSKIFYSSTLDKVNNYIQNKNNTFVIIDSNLKEYIKYFCGCKIMELDTSEHKKTLQSVEKIIDFLLKSKADRNSLIIGVGGGISTDIIGFAASIYKRGVQFAFIPSTLLAQVDASIGGKNGVNFNNYKNIIGTINLPAWILSSTELLKTLPQREFKAGIAEIVKIAILFSKALYNKSIVYFTELENHRLKYNTYLNPNGSFYKEEILSQIISECAELKCSLIERDLFEKGERRLLNLGHTFAHAIESEFQSFSNTNNSTHDKTIMHGEAVAIGIILAAKLAEKIKELENIIPDKEKFSQKLIIDFKGMGILTSLSDIEHGNDIDHKKIIDALEKDKKVNGNNINFILPYNIENVEDSILEIKYLEDISHDLR